MGGAVKGGLYGTLPDLTLAGEDDLTKKGRLIPTTSMTQYYATVLKWFGVEGELLDYVLPELKNLMLRFRIYGDLNRKFLGTCPNLIKNQVVTSWNFWIGKRFLIILFQKGRFFKLPRGISLGRLCSTPRLA